MLIFIVPDSALEVTRLRWGSSIILPGAGSCIFHNTFKRKDVPIVAITIMTL